MDLRLIAIQTPCNHKIRKKGKRFIEGCEDSEDIGDKKMWKMPVETAKYNRNKTLNATICNNETGKTKTVIFTLLRILKSCGNENWTLIIWNLRQQV